MGIEGTHIRKHLQNPRPEEERKTEAAAKHGKQKGLLSLLPQAVVLDVEREPSRLFESLNEDIAERGRGREEASVLGDGRQAVVIFDEAKRARRDQDRRGEVALCG